VLSFLPSSLLGAIALILFLLNTLLWCLPFYVLVLAKLALPVSPWRRGVTRALMSLAESWSVCNNIGLSVTQPTRWDVRGAESLSRRAWYLITCNHQSWVDVAVLQRAFTRRIPFPKFLLKKNLIWVPLLGGAWWALDFPFLKRHSKAFLEAHPEKRGEDLETTRKACQRLQKIPSAFLSFPEGTRFTPEKRKAQDSPYRNLLRPRAGGLAFVMEAMGERIESVLDVTIVYSNEKVSFWDLMSGRLRKVIVNVERQEIPQELRRGGYLEDPGFRERFQAWVGALWAHKDRLIESLQAEDVS
jgi:1-acyl-sn-glycerol-3-phosphate acyltransferase